MLVYGAMLKDYSNCDNSLVIGSNLYTCEFARDETIQISVHSIRSNFPWVYRTKCVAYKTPVIVFQSVMYLLRALFRLFYGNAIVLVLLMPYGID